MINQLRRDKIVTFYAGGETQPIFTAVMLDVNGKAVKYDLLEASHGKLLGITLNLLRLDKRADVQVSGVFYDINLNLNIGENVYLRTSGISQSSLLAKNAGVEELYVMLGKAVTKNSFILDIEEYKFA